MTAADIAAATGVTLEQAADLMAHFAVLPVVEQGTVTVTAHEILFCDCCGRRTFHEDGVCLTHTAPVKPTKRSRRR